MRYWFSRNAAVQAIASFFMTGVSMLQVAQGIRGALPGWWWAASTIGAGLSILSWYATAANAQEQVASDARRDARLDQMVSTVAEIGRSILTRQQPGPNLPPPAHYARAFSDLAQAVSALEELQSSGASLSTAEAVGFAESAAVSVATLTSIREGGVIRLPEDGPFKLSALPPTRIAETRGDD